jgi:hypothetical protein
MLLRVALVKTDVSEESFATIIRVIRIGEPGTFALISNRSTLLFQLLIYLGVLICDIKVYKRSFCVKSYYHKQQRTKKIYFLTFMIVILISAFIIMKFSPSFQVLG